MTDDTDEALPRPQSWGGDPGQARLLTMASPDTDVCLIWAQVPWKKHRAEEVVQQRPVLVWNRCLHRYMRLAKVLGEEWLSGDDQVNAEEARWKELTDQFGEWVLSQLVSNQTHSCPACQIRGDANSCDDWIEHCKRVFLPPQDLFRESIATIENGALEVQIAVKCGLSLEPAIGGRRFEHRRRRQRSEDTAVNAIRMQQSRAREVILDEKQRQRRRTSKAAGDQSFIDSGGGTNSPAKKGKRIRFTTDGLVKAAQHDFGIEQLSELKQLRKRFRRNGERNLLDQIKQIEASAGYTKAPMTTISISDYPSTRRLVEKLKLKRDVRVIVGTECFTTMVNSSHKDAAKIFTHDPPWREEVASSAPAVATDTASSSTSSSSTSAASTKTKTAKPPPKRSKNDPAKLLVAKQLGLVLGVIRRRSVLMGEQWRESKQLKREISHLKRGKGKPPEGRKQARLAKREALEALFASRSNHFSNNMYQGEIRDLRVAIDLRLPADAKRLRDFESAKIYFVDRDYDAAVVISMRDRQQLDEKEDPVCSEQVRGPDDGVPTLY